MKTSVHFLYLAQLVLECETFQTKVVEEIKTHFMFINPFLTENRLLYEITWKNTVRPDRPQMTTLRMRIACCIIKPTNSHSEYVVCSTFTLRQWLHESASVLGYTYIACLLPVRGPCIVIYFYNKSQQN